MTRIGMAYGHSLYDLTREESLSSQCLKELEVLETVFSETPDYLKLLDSHHLSKEERLAVLEEAFAGKIHPYVLNFLKILTEKGYIRHFSACYQAFRDRYHQDNNILPVTAVTALPLTAEQSEKLCAKLRMLTGKTIELKNRVVPSVLGGIRLDYDGKRVDSTVETRLAALRSLLTNTVL